jgi:hypothetical protein
MPEFVKDVARFDELGLKQEASLPPCGRTNFHHEITVGERVARKASIAFEHCR